MPDRGGFRTVAYFVNWAIYGRNHHPQELPADKLTHVLYAFANVRPNTGEVFLTDTWSDLEKHYPTDTWNEPTPGPHIYGCLKQLSLLKRHNRNLKVLLSIGGWSYSHAFPAAASDPSRRKTFASSATQILRDTGLDGLDIDWEYPASPTEANDFVALLSAVRADLDAYAAAVHLPARTFLLTVACPAGPANYERLRVREMDAVIDFWNVMAYDYAGSWDAVAGHSANVFAARGNGAAATPFSTAAAVAWYRAQGVRADKLVVGCPLYGRAFVGTDGPGTAYTGGVGEGSWEAGVWDWKALPREGANVHVDEGVVASWSMDYATRTMVSFDSAEVVRRKAEWVRDEGLGGVMWWESSGDRRVGEGSAVEIVEKCLGNGDGLERRQNVVDYPESKYRNMREGFPGG